MAQALADYSAQVAIGQVIHGMGGVGKSELARQYAIGHAQAYQLVWWITATSEERINAELASLAECIHPPLPQDVALSTVLGVEKAAGWALNWLQAHDGWLLILDNVEDLVDVRTLLAQLRNGHIVITTRRQVSWPANVTRLPLDLLTKDAATDLIALTTERPVDSRERPVLEGIAEELGYLPLALEQAGAYIRESQISPQDYQRLLAAHPLEMYGRSREGGEAERTIARLWSAHLDVIRSRNPYAEQVLRVLACYAPDDIPRDIIGGAAADILCVTDALRLLASYHLIKLEEQTVTMHRLLQKVVAAGGDSATEEWSSSDVALVWLTEAWSAAAELPRHEQVSKGRMLSPHVENLTWHAPVTAALGEHDWVFSAVGDFEHQQGNYHRAESLIRHAVTIAIASQGEEHPFTLGSRNNLALALSSLGRSVEAEAEHRTVLEARRRVLGEEHPDTLISRNNLALVLLSLGRLVEAEAEHRAVLEICRRVLGEEHPDTLFSRGNLAGALWSLGRLVEAEAEQRAVLEISKRVLGEEHPSTLISRGNLASALRRLGRLVEAEAEHRTVLEIFRRVLGEEHPDTLLGRDNLALVLWSLGRLVEAEAEHRTALNGRRRVLGEEHPDTLTSRSNAAAVLRELGQLVEAEAEHRTVLEISRRVLGEEHPDTLTSRGSLALVLWDLGRLVEAEAEQRAVLEARRRVLGEEHPDTLTSRNNLALALWSLGRLVEAEAEQRAVLEARRRVLGEEHPDTLTSRNNLAVVLRGLGAGGRQQGDG
ncbi:tetratricopeptide repeat protein [Nonomuraea sp. NPDC052129]|uniref:tetratricopeptide repeat protein n=1 Tax=Nonomuraea sp. NPDC052129 TaxID=3154651 RepID=UPI003446D89D